MKGDISPLEAAKARLPIPVLWKMLNLPGAPGRKCFCPFHDNQITEAASVFEKDGNYLFKCHAGCTEKATDAPGFLALAAGLSNEDACKKLIDMAGVMPASLVAAREKLPTNHKPAKPPFRKLEEARAADMEALSELRGIYIDAIRRAVACGHLWFADTAEGRAWVVTDARRLVVQSRRLDGKPWEGKGKSWTSVKETGGASWPVGAASIAGRGNILLCEGGGDFLCAHESPDAAPVAMLGASNGIHSEALPMFAGKRIRILAHGDDAGKAACIRWAKQLAQAGAADIKAVVLKGETFKDLNDIARLPYAECLKVKPENLLTFQ